MTDDKKTEDEPSIEEILSSIRDIISEDDEAEADAEVSDALEQSMDDDSESKTLVEKVFEEKDEVAIDATDVDGEDDILELTDLADEDEDEAQQEKPTGASDDPLAGIDLNHPDEDDLDIADGLDDILGGDDATEIEIEEDVEMTVTETVEIETDDALVDKVAESATIGAMAKLAENIAVSRTKEGITLEDIVKESLRPMLKDWLDENLPTLIERLVSQELERLANKAAGK